MLSTYGSDLLLGLLSVTILGFGLLLVSRPSFYFRSFSNSRMLDTPWHRTEIRIIGLVVSLFGLILLSAILTEVVKSELVERLNKNLLAALWIAFGAACITGAVSWIGWQFAAVRVFLRNHFVPEQFGSPAWERRMTIIFCSLISAILAIALILAAKNHPAV